MKIYKNINISLPKDFVKKTQELNLPILKNSGNYLLFRDYLRHYTSQHQQTASTKTRGEVRGGGHKPWRQKHIGRARSGSSRSPLWKGGGVIFGPKPKKISIKINKKERKLALQTLLYNKRKSILTIGNIEKKLWDQKTKTFLNFLLRYNIHMNKKTLLIVSQKTTKLKQATKNINFIELISISNLNTFSILKTQQIIITLSALHILKKKYHD